MTATELNAWAQACFANDRYATEATGIAIEEVRQEDRNGFARCSLQLNQCHRNARGSVMGGVFFTLADFAAAIAMNLPFAPEDLQWVSLSSSISFLSQPKGGRLTAETRCVRHGRTTCLYEVEIKEDDRTLALVATNGMKI